MSEYCKNCARMSDELKAAQEENSKNLELWDADVRDKEMEVARLREKNVKWAVAACEQRIAKRKAVAELDRMRKALEDAMNDDWGHKGGRLIYGNESMFGETGEFYKGYNAGVRGQFAKTRGILERALNPQPAQQVKE